MKLVLAVLLSFALFLAGCASTQQQSAAPQQPTASSMAPAAQSSTPAISLSQLALHNKETDCWVGYNGKVYDVTSFLPKHPNYQSFIVPLCGTSEEFASKFEAKHGFGKVGTLVSQSVNVGKLG